MNRKFALRSVALGLVLVASLAMEATPASAATQVPLGYCRNRGSGLSSLTYDITGQRGTSWVSASVYNSTNTSDYPATFSVSNSVSRTVTGWVSGSASFQLPVLSAVKAQVNAGASWSMTASTSLRAQVTVPSHTRSYIYFGVRRVVTVGDVYQYVLPVLPGRGSGSCYRIASSVACRSCIRSRGWLRSSANWVTSRIQYEGSARLVYWSPRMQKDCSNAFACRMQNSSGCRQWPMAGGV